MPTTAAGIYRRIRSIPEEDWLSDLYILVGPRLEMLERALADASAAETTAFSRALVSDVSQQIETLLGVVFVAAQSYLTRVRIGMINLSEAARAEGGRPLSFVKTRSAYELLALAEVLPLGGASTIEAVHGVATYWKHNDEWPTRTTSGTVTWDLSSAQSSARQTIDLAVRLGLQPGSRDNMRRACLKIGLPRCADLTLLHIILDDWVRALCERAAQELGIVDDPG